ncbi:hypothetical protein [Halobellus rarus]|uniref:Glycosyltransferase RgtA/B/C/D-like domain-containing protein n=1 Tax=Halobellus rarus TaxID=1126237 RepID=A0ABD6CJV3_9EURY|nr:hypothetical protein [Halobellus rarus]
MVHVYPRIILRLFLPAALLLALITSVTAFQLLGPVAGIKSGYILIGLLFAVVLYLAVGAREFETGWDAEGIGSDWKSDAGGRSEFAWFGSAVSPYKLVLVFVCVLVAAVAAADAVPGIDASAVRTGAIVVGLPVGYSALILQLRRGVPTREFLAQAVALYALDPLTKYLSTAFYFGRGDIPKHVHYIDLVATTGTWRSIPELSFYHYFPGLQTLGGSISLLTGFPAYDSLMLTGIVTYAIVICVSYLLARLLFSAQPIALCVALGTSMLAPIHRYSVYFYPQAFAVALVLILVFLSVRYIDADSTGYVEYLLLSAPLVVALWFTHHLTVVLFVPILLCLVAIPILAERVFGVGDMIRPRIPVLAIWVLGSVQYWLAQGVFVSSLLDSVANVFSQGEIAESEAGATIEALGTEIPEPSVGEAVLSLASAGGIYNILLVCALAFGVVCIVRAPARYRRAGGFVAVGLLGSVLMLRIPIDIHGLTRIQLPLSVFVAFLVGGGIYAVVSARNVPVKRIAPGLFVFVLLATAGPAVVSDDLYDLHSGPDLWETRTLPEPQKEFTATEMESFRQSAAYAERYDVTVETDWPSSIGLSRYGTDSEQFAVDDGRIRTEEELLLYRQRWTDHSVRLIPEQASLVTLLVSEEWLGETVRTENKVYTTGEVGLLADHSDGSQFERANP